MHAAGNNNTLRTRRRDLCKMRALFARAALKLLPTNYSHAI